VRHLRLQPAVVARRPPPAHLLQPITETRAVFCVEGVVHQVAPVVHRSAVPSPLPRPILAHHPNPALRLQNNSPHGHAWDVTPSKNLRLTHPHVGRPWRKIFLNSPMTTLCHLKGLFGRTIPAIITLKCMTICHFCDRNQKEEITSYERHL
jgi:hypothetical protein